MDIKETAKLKGVRLAAFIIGIVLIAILIFAAGVSVGFHKARYSYQWGENYERNFGGPERGPGPFGGMMNQFSGHDNFRNAHGLSGAIVSVTGNNLVIKDQDNKENTVAVTDKTVIKDGPDTIKLSDLKTDERIVVLGKPGDNGVVNADLIRVFSKDNNIPPAEKPGNNPSDSSNPGSNNTNNQNN